MREKLRPDYQSLNWVYAAEIVGDLPQIVIDTGRAMSRLWNELVWLHDRMPYRLLRSVEKLFRDMAADAKFKAGRAREHGDEEKASHLTLETEASIARAVEIKAAAEEVKKQSYRGFDLGLRDDGEKWSAPLVAATIAERRSDNTSLLDIPLDQRINHHTQGRGSDLGLPVWCKWYVGDTFKNALKAYAKKIRFAPRYKRGLDSIHIEQRTDSGTGWPIDALFAKRKPFSMRPETENGGIYEGWEAPAWFAINGERIPLRIIMHRPFPLGAIIKRYSLLGRYEPAFKEWRWRVLFQLETPPQRILYSLTNRIIAIDLGWRSVDDGKGIRLMMIYDGHQHVEIVLPYDLTSRRKAANLKSHSRIDIREASRIRGERDERLENCKANLRDADKSGWPEVAVKKLRGLTRMKSGGLMAVRKILAEAGITCEPIEEWLDADIPAWQEQRTIEEYWYATRDEILRTLAVELAEQCDQVRWEGNLNSKRMAEQESRQTAKRKEAFAESGEWESRTQEERRLEAAQGNRQLANHSQFRTWFREAMEKRGREIIDDETAYSSQICHECDGSIEPSADLIVKCSQCGALFDQDKNTTQYFWGRYDAETRAVAAPLASVDRSLLLKVWRVVSP